MTVALSRMGKGYAAPLRVENLDTFPHSVVFTKDPDYILFGFATGLNLLGSEINDIACLADKKAWVPLLRTNSVSRHPTIGSVY